MDNSDSRSTRGWATPKAAAAALLAGGVVLLVFAVVVSSDATGRFVMVIAAALLLTSGVYAWVIRPRLRLGPGALLTIRTLRGTVELTPDRVERVRVLTMRRVGRRSGQLEIDFVPPHDLPHGTPPRADRGDDLSPDSRIAVFSRWDLGADPGEVFAHLRDAGFPTD